VSLGLFGSKTTLLLLVVCDVALAPGPVAGPTTEWASSCGAHGSPCSSGGGWLAPPQAGSRLLRWVSVARRHGAGSGSVELLEADAT
jgi:hypothetical protein